jgi:hypothetical protein
MANSSRSFSVDHFQEKAKEIFLLVIQKIDSDDIRKNLENNYSKISDYITPFLNAELQGLNKADQSFDVKRLKITHNYIEVLNSIVDTLTSDLQEAVLGAHALPDVMKGIGNALVNFQANIKVSFSVSTKPQFELAAPETLRVPTDVCTRIIKAYIEKHVLRHYSSLNLTPTFPGFDSDIYYQLTVAYIIENFEDGLNEILANMAHKDSRAFATQLSELAITRRNIERVEASIIEIKSDIKLHKEEKGNDDDIRKLKIELKAARSELESLINKKSEFQIYREAILKQTIMTPLDCIQFLKHRFDTNVISPMLEMFRDEPVLQNDPNRDNFRNNVMAFKQILIPVDIRLKTEFDKQKQSLNFPLPPPTAYKLLENELRNVLQRSKHHKANQGSMDEAGPLLGASASAASAPESSTQLDATPKVTPESLLQSPSFVQSLSLGSELDNTPEPAIAAGINFTYHTATTHAAHSANDDEEEKKGEAALPPVILFSTKDLISEFNQFISFVFAGKENLTVAYFNHKVTEISQKALQLGRQNPDASIIKIKTYLDALHGFYNALFHALMPITSVNDTLPTQLPHFNKISYSLVDVKKWIFEDLSTLMRSDRNESIIPITDKYIPILMLLDLNTQKLIKIL